MHKLGRQLLKKDGTLSGSGLYLCCGRLGWIEDKVCKMYFSGWCVLTVLDAQR